MAIAVGQPGRLRGRRRVRGVVADRAQGAGRGAAARWLPEPTPTSRLGIDETRFRSVRWILDGDHLEAVRSVADQLRRLLPRRAGIAAGVGSWPHRRLCAGVARRADPRRSGHAIEIVVIDPSAPYASGIRAALPDAQDRGRQVASGRARQPDGHRGPAARHPRPARPPRHRRRPGLGEPAAAAHRRRTPVAPSNGTGSTPMLDSCDPTKEIGAAWGVKERLRLLLAEREPSKIRWRLADFYDAAIDAATARRPPDSHRPSRPGGQPSSSRSPRTSPTPAPKGSTGSSNKPSESAAATAT